MPDQLPNVEGGGGIFKEAQPVAAVGLPSDGNTTTAILGSGEVFTGAWETNNFEQVAVNCAADQAGTLALQFSPDGGATITLELSFDIAASTYTNDRPSAPFFDTLVKLAGRSFRAIYTNGGTGQGRFLLFTCYGNHAFPPSASIEAPIDGTRPSVNVRSVLTGKSSDDIYRNVRTTAQGSLIFAPQGTDAPLADRIFRFLDTVGDGSGTKNMIGDYSTPEQFKIVTAAGKINVIHRMIVYIQDTGTLDTDQYGALAALSNGIELKVYDDQDAEVLDLTDGVPIKTNIDWSRYCYDVTDHDWANGPNGVAVRWTFSNSGAPLFLPEGYYLAFECNDNLTGLAQHYAKMQGYVIDA